MGVNFSSFIGTNENSYSKVIAQTFALSEEFRTQFISLVNKRKDKSNIQPVLIDPKDEITEVLIDSDIDGNGRPDIFIKYENGNCLAIENKKWAGLGKNQLQRYSDSLEGQKDPFILIFLSPKHYKIDSSSKPIGQVIGEFAHINYADIEKICRNISQNTNDPFTKVYFDNLNEYIGGLIVKPFDSNEIQSFLYYGSGERKIIHILNDLKFDIEKIENSNSQYILVRRIINNNRCFFGFRMDNNWYYKAPLLNGKPELIVYVKDVDIDINNAKINNNNLERFFNSNKDLIQKNFNCNIDFYARKKNNECRLAIRKSFEDFNGLEVDKINLWFNDVLDYLKQLPIKI